MFIGCRSCKAETLSSIFSLGQMPLANCLLKADQLNQVEPKYHLEIMLCEDCGLVQLKDIVNPTHLFDEYLYFSSNSDTMTQSAKQLVQKIIPNLKHEPLVVEIASNDGYLLKHYINQGIPVLGIEPAKNIAEHAIQLGVPTQCEYFTADLARRLVAGNKQADVIHANNVMAHVPDLNDFVEGIKLLLKSQGQAVIEVPYLLNLINHCEFDTIYHEHVFYFSLLPLQQLFTRHQLVISDVDEIDIHGGSLRLYIKHASESVMSVSAKQLLDKEKVLGMDKIEYYHAFSQRIYDLKRELILLLESLKQKGQKIAAYGASAKGSTLLNFFGIGTELIDYIVDRSPAKQGYFMSGVHIPIYSPEFLLEQQTPYTLLLTWNFATEILKQQQAYRNQGGKFIVPIPDLQVV